MGSAVFMSTLEDGTVDEQEVADLETVIDFIEQHPDVGAIEIFKYVGENPNLQRALGFISCPVQMLLTYQNKFMKQWKS